MSTRAVLARGALAVAFPQNAAADVMALAVGLPVGLAYILGVHLLHALTLEQMMRIAARAFGVGGVPVMGEHSEISIDVDEPADYRFVVEQLGRCE